MDSHSHQHFASTADNHIIHIKDVIPSSARYFCPYCRQEMIARRGNIREWHFAHKAERCSYDNYLHTIAEQMIMEWFNTEDHIFLSMNKDERCDKYGHCIFRNEDTCTRKKQECFDLKNYYTICVPEHSYEGFIADLYCENKDGQSPIFIEIYVTHECSHEKKNSGIRIIELHIQSEDDILKIIKENTLHEGANVQLYNFRRKGILTGDFAQPFQKFILYHTLKSYVDRANTTCRNYGHCRKGIYEISMPYDDCMPPFLVRGGLYVVGKAIAYKDGYLKKDCDLCWWQKEDMSGDKFCMLYKKCGNPKYCKDNDAGKCSMFKENVQLVRAAVSEFHEYQDSAPVDIWKTDMAQL